MILELLRIVIEKLLSFFEALVCHITQAVILHLLLEGLLVKHCSKRLILIIRNVINSSLILISKSPFFEILFFKQFFFLSKESLFSIFNLFPQFASIFKDLHVWLILYHVISKELWECVVNYLWLLLNQLRPLSKVLSNFVITLF